MAANTPQSKKAKGSRAERKVAEAYRRSGLFPNARRMPLSGAFPHLKGDVFKGDYDLYVDEIKNQERVKLWEWWDQARAQCGINQHPLLHVTGNFRPILTVMDLDTYIDLRRTIKDLEEENRDLRKFASDEMA